MAKKNQLEFSQGGTKVRIIFKKGDPSPWYTDKGEALDALTDADENRPQGQRITVPEFSDMKEEILNAEDLPNHERVGSFDGLGVIMIGIGRHGSSLTIFGGGNSFFSVESFFGQARSRFPFDDVKPGDAYAKMCFCGGMHARIQCKDGTSRQFYSKEGGLEMITNLKSKDYIDDNEVERLKKEVAVLPLPETEAAVQEK